MSSRKRIQAILAEPSVVRGLRDWTDGKGLITVKTGSGRLRTIEREVEKASRTEADLTEPPLFDKPDKYRLRRPCTCKHHEGNRWRPVSEFSERKGKNGKMYPLSWCHACRAQYARDQYHGLNKRAP